MANDGALTTMTTDQLEAKLNVFRKLHTTVMAVFVVIVLTWVVTGYWRGNLPLFVSTLAMAVTISAAMVPSRVGLSAELKRRRQTAA